MATFVYPTATANYNGGKPAIGRDVRDDLDTSRTFIVGKNLEDTNIATMAGPLAWNISTNVKALSIVSTGNESLITISSEAELAKEISVDRLAASTDDTTAVLDLQRSGSSIFYASPEGSLLGPKITTVTRDAIGAPRQGDVIYNTSLEQYDYYNDTAWKELGQFSPDVSSGSGFVTNTSNQAQSWVTLQTLAGITVQRANTYLLFLIGNAAVEADIGFIDNDLSDAGPTTKAASFRWLRQINAGGYVEIQRGEVGGYINIGVAGLTFHDFGIRVPPGAMNTIDITSTAVVGDTVDYRIEVDSKTNGEFAFANAVKIVVAEL